ncbi:MAG: hypothetical protein JST40_10350 [Armatimonadetes bacterium]|nr:hypothetical protein [Armatimonadota bacterium]
MRILAIPNWSFGRSNALLRACRDFLESQPVELHYLKSDLDHNRTVSAISGQFDVVAECLHELAERILPGIDLNRHIGVHPRIGALDVCPFVVTNPADEAEAKPLIESFADRLASRWNLPVFLYEKSEKGRHEASLPLLRKGGFGGLFLREIDPDFGPAIPHPQFGASIVGLRDFLIAFNINLKTSDLAVAKQIAMEIRELRAKGDPCFLGVRSLGFPLPSRDLVQVSMNLTLPDMTPIDPLIEWVRRRASELGTVACENELIGVIRPIDALAASFLPYQPQQIVAVTHAF